MSTGGFGEDFGAGAFGGDAGTPFVPVVVPIVIPPVPPRPSLAPSNLVTSRAAAAVASSIYGVDIDCLNGIGFVLGLASGMRNLANALARRLITPRGGLFYDPDYGFDVRNYLNVALTRSKQGELVSGIEDECRKDTRVQDLVALVTAVGFPATNLNIALQVTPSVGPTFPLILKIGDLVSGLTIAPA